MGTRSFPDRPGWYRHGFGTADDASSHWASALGLGPPSGCAGVFAPRSDSRPRVLVRGDACGTIRVASFSCQIQRFSRCFWTLQPGSIYGQKTQIVQSRMTSDDFLPRFTHLALCSNTAIGRARKGSRVSSPPVSSMQPGRRRARGSHVRPCPGRRSLSSPHRARRAMA